MSEDNQSNPLEQIAQQLNMMMQAIENLNVKQSEHDAIIRNVTGGTNGSNSSAGSATSAVQENVNRMSLDHIFKIPDPIKMLPTFDGNSKQLNHWLTTAEEALNAFENYVTPLQFKMYVTAVTNKIQGKAKDIICLAGSPDDLTSIKEVLVKAIANNCQPINANYGSTG